MDSKLNNQEIESFISDMPDEVLERLTFAMPWQISEIDQSYSNDDEESLSYSAALTKEDTNQYRVTLQQECWRKFQTSPQVNTAVRGLTGRLVGAGFRVTSPIAEIQDVIDAIELDWRNQLYKYWPKYVARSNVEGELFLLFTLHNNGFVEIDFVDPTVVSGGGDDGTGIIFHPNKTLMPVFYNLNTGNNGGFDQVPSIYVARFPELVEDVKDKTGVNVEYQGASKSKNPAFRKLGGYRRFICAFEKGFMTKRAIGYLRTTILWLNHYENLKKYEIDHKKSSGAYVWSVRITDPRTFKLWLSLTDEERRKTGIMAKKTPGSTIVLPAGMELKAEYPQLSKISGEDTDIHSLVTSGLNEPEDVSTGQSRGTYASIKASRGPASDRIMDEIAYFERWLKYDFWSAIFYLRSAVTSFPEFFSIKEAVGFKNKEPIFRKVKRAPERTLEIDFPTSEMIDFESRAKGLLGVKHGPIAQSLGISNKEVARRLGINSYGRARLEKATEDEMYPELIYNPDTESAQDQAENKQDDQATQKRPALVKRAAEEK